jgi:hypothetical protein
MCRSTPTQPAWVYLCAVCTAQVAAYCDGRDTVSEYDCLLLEHVLWQEPEHAAKISDWLLAQLAVDDGMKQVSNPSCGPNPTPCKPIIPPSSADCGLSPTT